MTREERNAYHREWRARNKERLNAEQRERYANDVEYREKMKANSGIYKSENPEKVKEYVENNKEKLKIYNANYYVNNTIEKRRKAKERKIENE